jgi:hypothetical protein
MQNDYKKEDVLRYVYGELEAERVEELRLELLKNTQLRDYYKQIKVIKDQLNQAIYNPDQSSIEIILDESSSYSSLETSH